MIEKMGLMVINGEQWLNNGRIYAFWRLMVIIRICLLIMGINGEQW
jgi:hypothetical protein